MSELPTAQQLACEHDAGKKEKVTPNLSYTAFFDWADGMVAKGWEQRKCGLCGLYKVWGRASE